MKYLEFANSGVTSIEIQGLVTDPESVLVTLRMLRSLRDSAKKAARLFRMSLASSVKMCLVDRLSGADRK